MNMGYTTKLHVTLFALDISLPPQSKTEDFVAIRSPSSSAKAVLYLRFYHDA
jgi:hypothetical protein